MLGKLENGIFYNAPTIINHGGFTRINPSEDLLLELGYLPVVDTPCPEQNIEYNEEGLPLEEPKYYESHWEEQNGRIVKVWEETTPPEPQPEAPTLSSMDVRLSNLESRLSSVEENETNLELALTEVYELVEEEQNA